MTDTTLKGATLPAAGEPDKANGTKMVTIGCKQANGILCEMGKFGQEEYTRVYLNGSNSARVIGGFGFTQVSQSFWEAWYKKNKHLEFVRKGVVFVHGDNASAEDHAKDRAELKTGFEPIDPMQPILGADGKPIVEVDAAHFQQGRQDMTQFGGGRRRAG